MFINAVPMLMELQNEKSFAENLSETENTAFSVFRHQRYNYRDVLTDIREQFGFQEKLYDVVLSYQNANIGDTGYETTWYHCGMQTEHLQIHIEDRDNEGKFRIHYDYLCDCFSEKEIGLLHRNLMNLLFSAIEDDSKKLYEPEMLTEEEKQKLLIDFNDTAVDYPREKSVSQLFEEQVKENPEKTAVIACDKTLTYEQLNEEAERIAGFLQEKGVGKGDMVAFALPRRSFLIAAILGILKTGAAYVPIDPDLPEERIVYMLADSQAKYCLNEQLIAGALACPREKFHSVAVLPENVCYCIYTSGSTGNPKGTLITHKNAVNYVCKERENHYARFFSEKCKTVLSVTTVSFDIFVTECLLPLANGMTILFADEKQAKLPAELNRLMQTHSADVMQTTPTKLRALLSDVSQTDFLKQFRRIILGRGLGRKAGGLAADIHRREAAECIRSHGNDCMGDCGGNETERYPHRKADSEYASLYHRSIR